MKLSRRSLLKNSALIGGVAVLTPDLSLADSVFPKVRQDQVIQSLPIVIREPGNYRLERNFITHLTQGFAIDIATHDVVIDLNGFYIANAAQAAIESSAVGVNSYFSNNITVKNGKIINFYAGVNLESICNLYDVSDGDLQYFNGHGGCLVENLYLENIAGVGISVFGQGTIIRRNTIVELGKSARPFGSLGIIAGGDGYIVESNTITVRCPRPSNYLSVGMVAGSGAALVDKNTINNCHVGIADWGNYFDPTNSAKFGAGNVITNALTWREII